MSVQNSDWSLQQNCPIFREPDPPISSDSHSGHQLVECYMDTSGQASTDSSLGPPCLDINQASNWPEFRILLQQLPPQDSDEHYCLALGEDELAQLRLFCAQRKQKSLGQGVARLLPPKLEGHTCEKCKKLLNPGEYGVFAARAGEQSCWHRACFACQACGQALINLIYFYHDGHLYCGRHHAELLRPRCPACDQLIFSQRCTEAEGRRWHENHFCCQDCAGPLGAGPYALPGGSPCCPSCFENRYQSAGSNSEEAPEGHASLGGTGPDPSVGWNRACSDDKIIFRDGLFSTVASSTLGPPSPASKGQDRDRPQTPGNPKEDSFCPTCSSSSESEPEGFFFGQRLPGPWKTPENLQADDRDISRKHCTIC
ncbi:prickle-like protein 4 isoform X1 [Cricetulus griseus]|uniref:Prickle planar cell polarity protein 4 n=1 Tax=Cricetulus griseus TaxID=10029 RepID=A0A061INE8_CRIGR|nr:prickle-like protein 4 isoform X1 [Cricetulus griseus]XP_007647804.1 prickle-like protein 4 isoform X1 [Cricetulus griseus]XP_007647805.1 prickle-like protein 4 isoform X1 [Cricetulus griseus]XP_007647806.1 prickle-like protein 4 isoform X1 [Cricetulus griseus]XP_016834476.1 prickle-like protein 4 isoform X1 [Cricetulus griseus]XP_027250291.1 prickle-like protein 4 isoform X1 [Cricetulus griseus]XP_027250292.1 prickle-like protein 4 isoform X1 [Cricetulus griseus]XP_027250293.1 prickle-li